MIEMDDYILAGVFCITHTKKIKRRKREPKT